MKFVIVTLALVVILGSTCVATRSRRSIGGWFVDTFVESLLNMMLTGDEHTFAYTMYKSYRGHDGCFERLLCELGARLQEFQGSTRMLSYISNFVPPAYRNLIETLKQASQGTSCDDIGNPISTDEHSAAFRLPDGYFVHYNSSRSSSYFTLATAGFSFVLEEDKVKLGTIFNRKTQNL